MMPPLKEFNSVMSHANTVSAHPAQFALLKRGLYPGYRQFRHNFDVLYKFHCGAPLSPSTHACIQARTAEALQYYPRVVQATAHAAPSCCCTFLGCRTVW